VKIMQINGLRTLTSALNNDHSTIALGATNKMYWSEYHRDTMELALDILGMEGQILTGDQADGNGGGDMADFMPATRNRRHRPGYPVSTMQEGFFFSRSETIWGGTAQIQRNIVGERVLGLPKEPKAGA
jgi:alkylation response protein AidB-like acyl-CoA dehydrogenase